MKIVTALGFALLLAACSGRAEPQGSFLDPVCMPDGSVSFTQQANADGTYGDPRASKANCSWNKPKPAM